jgi:hypothetical protein
MFEFVPSLTDAATVGVAGRGSRRVLGRCDCSASLADGRGSGE